MAYKKVAAFGAIKCKRLVPRLGAPAVKTFIASCIGWFGLAAQTSMAYAATPSSGVWLMGTTVAIQTFDCGEMLCGRVIWLKVPLNPQGLLKRDALNPDPALRERQICGPTIIWNLRPAGGGRWEEGWFYNADDGRTYRLAMEQQSQDVMVARAYLGLPLFGQTRVLTRILLGTTAGWC